MAPRTKTLQEKLYDKVSVDADTKCWNFTGTITAHGYGQLHHNGKNWRAHRLSWVEANGEIPAGKIIRHTCDNRRCVNPEHLYAGTYSDNTNDAYRRNRRQGIPCGENHHNAKLNKSDVSEIRRSAASTRALARKFDVSQSTISEARLGKTWKDVR